MPKAVLKAVLRVLAGTIFILALAATIGIPAGKRGPAAAQVAASRTDIPMTKPRKTRLTPKAIRTPNPGVRCVTRHDITSAWSSTRRPTFDSPQRRKPE